MTRHHKTRGLDEKRLEGSLPGMTNWDIFEQRTDEGVFLKTVARRREGSRSVHPETAFVALGATGLVDTNSRTEFLTEDGHPRLISTELAQDGHLPRLEVGNVGSTARLEVAYVGPKIDVIYWRFLSNVARVGLEMDAQQQADFHPGQIAA